MEKRTLLAITLAILVMASYSFLMAKYYPPKEGSGVEEFSLSEMPVTKREIEGTLTQEPPFDTVAKEPYHNRITTVSQFSQGPEVKEDRIKTEFLEVLLTNQGGSIKEIWLKRFFQSEDGEPILLARALLPREAAFSIEGFDERVGLEHAIFEKKDLPPHLHPSRLDEGVDREPPPFGASERTSGGKDIKTLVYEFIFQDEFKVTKKYAIPNDKYCIELELKIENLTSYPKTSKYKIMGASRIDRSSPMDVRFVEAAFSANGKIDRFSTRAVAKSGKEIPGQVSWAALRNKYFSLILKPFIPTSGGLVRPLGDGTLSVGAEAAPFTILPHSTLTQNFLLYAGPNDFERLAGYNLGLEDSVSFGFFGGISKLLLAALRFFYKITHNYGLAIICLTLAIFVMFYPLTLKSLKSMKQMQEMQPKVDKLRQEFKSNPQKLNKEIMELYRRHKVNPMGGCLPMLLQMPIFISLYQTLVRSIELKGANFLWIKDLSAPDRAFRLPITLPILGNFINILPLLMMAAMFFQQRLSTPRSKVAESTGSSNHLQQQQKMMGTVMPLMFGMIFYNLPSGLVLYWLSNTVLMIANQAKINKGVKP